MLHCLQKGSQDSFISPGLAAWCSLLPLPSSLPSVGSQALCSLLRQEAMGEKFSSHPLPQDVLFSRWTPQLLPVIPR